MPHPKYSRKGNDLYYVHKLPLTDALFATPLQIETLDNRQVLVSTDEIINPKYKKIIQGEGMPIYKDDPLYSLKKEKEKGSLIITFDIAFPKFLPSESKERLKELIK